MIPVLKSPHSRPAEQNEFTLPHFLTEIILINANENGIFPGFAFSVPFPVELCDQMLQSVHHQLTSSPWNTNRQKIYPGFSENLVQVYYRTLVSVLLKSNCFLNMQKYNLSSFLRYTTEDLVNYSNRLSGFSPLKISIPMAMLPWYNVKISIICRLPPKTGKQLIIKLRSSLITETLHLCVQKPIDTYS